MYNSISVCSSENKGKLKEFHPGQQLLHTGDYRRGIIPQKLVAPESKFAITDSYRKHIENDYFLSTIYMFQSQISHGETTYLLQVLLL